MLYNFYNFVVEINSEGQAIKTFFIVLCIYLKLTNYTSPNFNPFLSSLFLEGK